MRINQLHQIFFILIFLVSCGSQKSQDYNHVAESMVVDWNIDKDRVVPKIDESSPVGNEYGPVPQEEEKIKKIEESQKPTALLLGPGGYRTLSYLSLLKELKLRGETPHVVIGHGLGAVMAAYFSFGYQPDYIEWKFFKFTKKAKDLQIYSEDWLRLVEKELIDELKEKRIEQGKLTLIVPVLSKKWNRVIYLKRGNLQKSLMANVDLLGKEKSPYRPSFFTEIINQKTLDDLGIGKVIVIDLLKDGINWKRGMGILNGHFQKSASLFQNLSIKNKVILEYPLGTYPIDDLGNSADLLYRSKEISRKKIGEWILSKSE